MRLGTLAVRVIDLDTLIELKEKVGREKDAAVIAILKRTRDECRTTDRNDLLLRRS